MCKRKTTEQFIAEARAIHGEKYDYSKVKYVSNKGKVIITCPIHGEFQQRAIEHLRSCGCTKCAKDNSKRSRGCGKDIFIEKAKAIHGDKYDYSKVNYVNSYTPVVIVCPIHGEFTKLPKNHIIEGQGCPTCSMYEKGNRRCLTYGKGERDKKFGVSRKAFNIWNRMLRRCYDEFIHTEHPKYIECSVCESWLSFSSFEKWFNEHYVEGWELDKDILVKGNKEYSPDKCCFVPHEINVLFRCNVKEDTIRRKAPLLAEKYKDRLEERVYKRLCNI